jgi:teichuronic acid biosynthesis glycosyltransferase TuaG
LNSNWIALLQGKNTISVVTPSYNRANELVAALESVLAQTYPVKEIWVCDDGSTDNSKQRVQGFNDPRIQWLPCGRNGRPAVPRNIGVRNSSADWIAFLDSDDTWAPEKLAQQIELAVQGPYDAVCTNAWRIAADGSRTMFFETIKEKEFTLREMIDYNRVICSSMMCRRELLFNCGLFPESLKYKAIEDYILWLKIAGEHKIGYVDAPLVDYRDIPAASIRKEGTDSVNQRVLIFNHLKKQRQYFTKDQLLYLYKKFKWDYKSEFWQKFDLEKLTL